MTAVVARVAMSDGMAGGGNSGAALGRGKIPGRAFGRGSVGLAGVLGGSH